MKPKNLPEVLFKQAKKYKDRTFLQYRIRRNVPYKTISWKQYDNLVRCFAHGLLKLGLRKGERLAIISDTRYEWAVTDYATLCCGAVVVPVYPTLPDQPVEYILNNCQAEIVVVENKGQLQKIRGQWDKLPHINYVIVIDDMGDIPKGNPKILTMQEVINIGEDQYEEYKGILDDCVKQINREDLATIIYTSGTTGDPKGVELTHNNILSVTDVLPDSFKVNDKDMFLSFLPLSHVFERVGNFHYAISIGAPITYCMAVDRIGKGLVDSKATVMCVVPRLLEKMYTKVQANLENRAPSIKKLVEDALGLSIRRIEYNQKTPQFTLQKITNFIPWFFADLFILKKIRTNIAPRIRSFISGGAPLSVDIAKFFHALGFLVLEGYGLTETSAPATVNPTNRPRLGTVGKPLTNVEIKIAEDGEILIKGPTVFRGYYKNPEATEATFTDGWFKTGDIGEIDEEGYLKITDRKKDLIVSSAGKNIAPQELENSIRNSKYISNVVVIGNKRKYLSALVTLEVRGVLEFTRSKGKKYTTNDMADVSKDKDVIELIGDELRLHTAQFADYEQIRKFTILEGEFTVRSGEITPTLKVKRRFIENKHKEIIDQMY